MWKVGVIALAAVLIPSPARGDAALYDEVVALVERWVAAQNSRDAHAYAACYEGTADERAIPPAAGRVGAVGIEVLDLTDGQMRATFTAMRDRGASCSIEHKEMTIAGEFGRLRIRHDETSSASDVPMPCGHRCEPVCSRNTSPRSRQREIKECEVACERSAYECVRLADVYAGGLCGAERDLDRAVAIVDAACRRHETFACLAAARFLEERNGVGDVAHAVALLDPYCSSARDCVDIDVFARLLRQRNESDDAARALRMLSAACGSDGGLGDAAKACGIAADMYEAGEGAARNPRRARALRARASRLWQRQGKPSCCAE